MWNDPTEVNLSSREVLKQSDSAATAAAACHPAAILSNWPDSFARVMVIRTIAVAGPWDVADLNMRCRLGSLYNV